MRRRATLPHPSECSTIAAPGLSFRVRNGTGRLTWAMTAAKPPSTEPTNNGRPRPWDRVDGPGTGQRTRTKPSSSSFRDPMQRSTCHHNEPHRRNRPTPHKGMGMMSPSPVSTGRLHPSRGFHLRPIKHVFYMRATDARRRQGILILEQASRLDAFSGYPFRT